MDRNRTSSKFLAYISRGRRNVGSSKNRWKYQMNPFKSIFNPYRNGKNKNNKVMADINVERIAYGLAEMNINTRFTV